MQSVVRLRRLGRVLMVVALPILVGAEGCNQVESVIARDDEPGVYKGPVDPLTEKSAEERASTLSDRLQLIQAR